MGVMAGGEKVEKIKVGIIGTGFIGPAHIEAIRRLGFAEVKKGGSVLRNAISLLRGAMFKGEADRDVAGLD
jgi:predicted dehydrogenase